LIELGSFIFLNALSFGFLGYGTQKSLPMSGILHIVSMVLFFGLAFYMILPEDIGMTTSYADSDGKTATFVKIFMGDTETDIMTWVYMGMGTISLLSFMVGRAVFNR